MGYWMGSAHYAADRLVTPTSLIPQLPSPATRSRQWMAYLGGFAVLFHGTEKIAESWIGYYDYRTISLATFVSTTGVLSIKTLKPFMSFGVGLTVAALLGGNDYFYGSSISQRLHPTSLSIYGPDPSPGFPVDGIHERLLAEKHEKNANHNSNNS